MTLILLCESCIEGIVLDDVLFPDPGPDVIAPDVSEHLNLIHHRLHSIATLPSKKLQPIEWQGQNGALTTP